MEETKTNDVEVEEAKKQAEEAVEESAAEVTEEQTEETVEEQTEQAVETEKVEQAEAAATDEKSEDTQDSNNVGMKKGDIVTGKIVKIEDAQVIVDLGYKFDGVVPLRELSPLQLEIVGDFVQLGDEIELKVIRIDEDDEKLVLSKRAVDASKAWEQLEQQFNDQTIIEAEVADVVKGGLVVDVGVRGFIPASMVERHFVEDFSSYKGRTLRLRVKEIDREKNKVILSHKDVLEEEYDLNKQEILEKLEIGKIITGKVQRLTPFGAFVDIGGIDGLVHISEMAWSRVEHPSDVVNEGDEIKVKVLKVDPENERISLSIKETLDGPWESIEGKISDGDIITGTVKRLVNFGAFVEIADGVEGLVHISQISHHHINTPQEELEEGQEIKVKVLELSIADKRASLSIKETLEEPEYQKSENNNSFDRDSQGLNFTLGERFGDKLDQFKK